MRKLWLGRCKNLCRSVYVDKLFMGTDGYIPGIGFTCGDMMRAEAMKSMMGVCEKSDHSDRFQ